MPMANSAQRTGCLATLPAHDQERSHMNVDDYASDTNSCLVVAPSKVNGLGLFSREEISKGHIVGRCNGLILSTPNKRTIQIERRRHITSHYIDFINHQCRPTTCVRVEGNSIALYAIEYISARNDEITIDYNCSEYSLAESFFCRCCRPQNHICGYSHLIETSQTDYLRRIEQFALPHLLELGINAKGVDRHSADRPY
ncbi:hypothetical protein XH96_33150 [Bradyrhizobium sp. CCBAU 51765]|nr:hypothetical protein XH96_33150 [Bradyrhizobium sp. CCBAU 51765]